MPVLTPGTVLRSRTPTLLVENKLAAGTWRFQLTVVDDSGNESEPAILTVRVQAPTTPTPPGPILRPGPIFRPNLSDTVTNIRRPV